MLSWLAHKVLSHNMERLNTGDPGPQLRAAAGAEGDDDDAEEIFDAPGDFYADAFEVLE